VVTILALLTVAATQQIRRYAERTQSVANLRQLGTAGMLYAQDRGAFESIMFRSDDMNTYLSIPEGTEARDIRNAFLVDETWNDRNGLENIPSYSMNGEPFKKLDTLDPAAEPWEKLPIPYMSQPTGQTIWLFTGVYNPPIYSVYNWGNRRHWNPVYSGQNKTVPGDDLYGESLCLFWDVSVSLLNFDDPSVDIEEAWGSKYANY
jgi:hypothetical protein